jgi:membrane protein implicated in regulation of membrane protease activity
MVSSDLVIGLPFLLIGVVLFIVEAIHPGVFLLIPGTALIAGGVIAIVAPNVLIDSVFGPAIILGAAVVATVISIPYYRRIAPVHGPMATIPMSLAGQTGLVITAVQPDSLRGKVRVNSEVWSARADRMIPEGTRVRILGGEGVAVRVEPLDEVVAMAAGKAS